jgi:phosphonoacetaldehyde hydrolase
MSSPFKTLRAVIFDWAGTTIDYGSRAPTSVFLEIFRQSGVEISAAEARGPMGMAKRAHIAAVLQMPRVVRAWTERFGAPATDADVDRLYEQFLPLQLATLQKHCDLIPGAVELLDHCRHQGIRVGSTTGYTRALMDVVQPRAAEQGYAPDVVVCSDEVTAGRPAPWSNFRAAEQLGVYPVSDILVVDDTVAGIQAGRNGGMWTVAVTQTGNALALSQAEAQSLPGSELAARLQKIETDFYAAGAHQCIPSIADLPDLLASFG